MLNLIGMAMTAATNDKFLSGAGCSWVGGPRKSWGRNLVEVAVLGVLMCIPLWIKLLW